VQYDVTFAGFGGQGIMAIGQVLALAGMEEGRHVVWLPSYGPEMRGGTAYCTVVIADRPIGSPIISHPSCVAVFNRPSFDKFGPKVKPDGLLLVNSSLINVKSDRKDIDQLYVPANDLAIQAGNPKSLNMIMLGAFIGRSGIVKLDTIKDSLKHKMGKKADVLALNLKLVDAGYKLAQEGKKGKK
jgi:2-oxoglutarate ferredoxin oxidoreductase subunit gamma